MTNDRVAHHVSSRLSLRPPQAESLQRLVKAVAAAPGLFHHERDLAAILKNLKEPFTTLEDFERDFPSLCFSLATGVGKTRLMGAFISYLHLAHGINNFFVLAPSLTIYNKLISDFTPNTRKYVFKGIGEFAVNPPKVITGDNYEQQNITGGDLLSDVRINIFNISKINSEVRGGKEPRIKRMQEVLGDSYFNHLANLPDLVLLMDESHRYRAQAGMRAINELNPLFGLEVTATPFVESTKGPVPFKNVVMDYPLAQAIKDGFVKEPAVVTQRNFKASNYSADKLEEIKLEDGIRLHEVTKAELLTYARESGAQPVKPFVLIIARDTTHASQLKAHMDSDRFFGGRYNGKVIQVDSSRTGAEEEKMIEALLNVEKPDEPTEIVIHVNMLKEGWDVTNLYTIIPLRAANARTLIEQSIGRGLRLPYGKRTGVAAVDRLNIVAHDKFQEIIDEANRSDSIIRKENVIEIGEILARGPQISTQVLPNALAQLGVSPPAPGVSYFTSGNERSEEPESGYSSPEGKPLFVSPAEKLAVRAIVEVIGSYETRRDLTPSSAALLTPDLQQRIVAEVAEKLKPVQKDLLEGVDTQVSPIDLSALVAKATEVLVKQTIDIPRITVVPTGETTTGFHPFTLGALPNFQPGSRDMLGQELRTSEQFSVKRQSGPLESRLEDYIVKQLIDFDEIDYFTQAEFLYDLASQVVEYYSKQSFSESELHQILRDHATELARLIHAQMMEHFWENASGYEVKVSRGFTGLKPCNFTTADEPPRNFRETLAEVSKIKQMRFSGFSRCLYPEQKFDSDTERRFAIILERDSLKWFKPAKGQFQIYYKLGTEQPEYVPDFVVEDERQLYLVETKARTDIESAEVKAKAAAATRWCEHASQYAIQVGTKPWRYLLIPHDEIEESRKLVDFLRFAYHD